MNKVVEWYLRAKDMVSSTLDRVSKKFHEVGTEAEQAAKKTEKLGGSGGAGGSSGKGAIEVLNDELVKSTGLLGKVGGAMGKFGGTAAAAIGAFKLGWDIGTWINEKVITPLFGIKDPIEELKKQNRLLKYEAERAFKAWAESMDDLDSSFAETERLLKNQADEVNNLAYAYQKLQQAQEKQIKAEEDAQLLKLQRDKFADMEALNQAGNSIGASQVGLFYDVEIAQRKREQELAKFDRETERSKQAQITAQKQLNGLSEEELKLENHLAELQRRKADIEENASAQNYEQEMKRVDQQITATITKLDAQFDKIEQKRADLAAAGIEAGARDQERRNLEESLQQEIDARAKAYDDFLQRQEDEEYQAFLDEQEREQAELDRQRQERLAADLEAEKKLHAQRVRDVQNEIAESTAAQSAASADLSAAKAQVAKAWGWYRNKDSMKAYIDEQNADKLARQQFEKDFERLKSRRRDWRTVEMGKLSVEDEATRQVALAKEAEQAAQKRLDEISENTAAIRDIYEALTGGEE